MQTTQCVWTEEAGWSPFPPGAVESGADLVFIFAATQHLRTHELFDEVRAAFPEAILFGSSTAGEISDINVFDESFTVTAVKFAGTHLEYATTSIDEVSDSFEAGVKLAQSIPHFDLQHVLVLSDGLRVNGSFLIEGLRSVMPEQVPVTGGLSGDGAAFSETLVIGNDRPRNGLVAAIGLYGSRIRVGYGSLGGWDPFGPDRLVTRSRENVLFEVDGKSALDLYKTYLGEHAGGLPATGLLFPLCLRPAEQDDGVVRTLLAVDEQEQSMTFAGNVPEGEYVRLMKANIDRLVDGAQGAARISLETLADQPPELAILISCVGRKMVLKQRVEEEVEVVREILGPDTTLTGFYSYGEISPFSPGARSRLHNQTMTITTLVEI
ncbi:MAG: FIST N-terminal domain-containing protein [bacterium]